ncbi:SO_0444 family Cu/Zn efflux transporter [candidate division KSB1 bacterium]
MEIVTGLLSEIWRLTNEMSPYILFGLFVAGILHVLIPRDKIYNSFSKNNTSAVIKASLFGVPLPLCSCGVIPVAALLRKEGAGKGPVISFLSSTPTTGIDSIFATYALLGPLFAVIRPLNALFTGIFGGMLTNLTEKNKHVKSDIEFTCSICSTSDPHSHGKSEKIKKIFTYAFFDLVRDISKWLIIGIVIGGLIGYFLPSWLIEQYLGSPVIAYLLMLVIGIPMYVCATGSIPIAASLIMKGLTPGAGLVFLIVGPATNTATMTFIAGKLGKKSLISYLTAIVISAVLFGVFVDWIWITSGKNMNLITGEMEMLPLWLKVLSSVVLIGLMGLTYFKKEEGEILGTGKVFKVPDMDCEHCKKSIDAEIRKLEGIQGIHINLKTKEVEVTGDAPEEHIVSAIKKAGYDIEG